MFLFTLLSLLCFQLEITKQVCGDTAMIDFPVAALVLGGSCKSHRRTIFLYLFIVSFMCVKQHIVVQFIYFLYLFIMVHVIHGTAVLLL